MLNKIILGVLLLLTVINIVILFQIKKIANLPSAPSSPVETQLRRCRYDPISECFDRSRFPASVKKGRTWAIDETTRDAYSKAFIAKYLTPVSSVFVSKRALNKIFADDLKATGIICTFAYDAEGKVGLMVEAGQSDSTEISSTVASSGSSLKGPLLGLLGISEAKAATFTSSSQIFYSKIYCPPKCPTSDSTQTDSVRRHHDKAVD